MRTTVGSARQAEAAEEQDMLQILQGDPQMRTVFIDEVAGPDREQDVRMRIDSMRSRMSCPARALILVVGVA